MRRFISTRVEQIANLLHIPLPTAKGRPTRATHLRGASHVVPAARGRLQAGGEVRRASHGHPRITRIGTNVIAPKGLCPRSAGVQPRAAMRRFIPTRVEQIANLLHIPCPRRRGCRHVRRTSEVRRTLCPRPGGGRRRGGEVWPTRPRENLRRSACPPTPSQRQRAAAPNLPPNSRREADRSIISRVESGWERAWESESASG